MNNQLIHLVEEFKIPYNDSNCPGDWKDWYHYILYNPHSQIRILYNLCFNGTPGTGYITDTLLITLPKGYLQKTITSFSEFETFGFSRNHNWESGNILATPFRFIQNDIMFSIRNNITYIVSDNNEVNIKLDIRGIPLAEPIFVPERQLLENGSVGWGIIPGFCMTGSIYIDGKLITIDKEWFCYHDRNFGRFRWGNIGYIWFVSYFTGADKQTWTYVLHRGNTTDFAKVSSPILFIYRGNVLAKIFLSQSIDIQFSWHKSEKSPQILPGSMASLFNDRTILMPSEINILAQDENDFTQIKMVINSFTELIIPDYKEKQYSFVKELSGTASVSQNIENENNNFFKGCFYAEHVH